MLFVSINLIKLIHPHFVNDLQAVKVDLVSVVSDSCVLQWDPWMPEERGFVPHLELF